MESGKVLTEYERERRKPLPSRNHSIAQALLIGALGCYSDRFTIVSELTLDLKPYPLTPDICIYPPLKIDWIHDKIRMSEPPLLVVEILSLDQDLSDPREKLELYFVAGVKSGWLVQPSLKSIAVFTPDMNSTVFTAGEMTDPALGITINLDEIFG